MFLFWFLSPLSGNSLIKNFCKTKQAKYFIFIIQHKLKLTKQLEIHVFSTKTLKEKEKYMNKMKLNSNCKNFDMLRHLIPAILVSQRLLMTDYDTSL